MPRILPIPILILSILLLLLSLALQGTIFRTRSSITPRDPTPSSLGGWPDSVSFTRVAASGVAIIASLLALLAPSPRPGSAALILVCIFFLVLFIWDLILLVEPSTPCTSPCSQVWFILTVVADILLAVLSLVAAILGFRERSANQQTSPAEPQSVAPAPPPTVEVQPPTARPQDDPAVTAARDELLQAKPVMGVGLVDTSDPGIKVTAVRPGGACDAAGVIPGDVIQQVDGIQTDSHAEFQAVMARAFVGELVKFTVERDGVVLQIPVVVGGKGLSVDRVAQLRDLAGREWCHEQDQAAESRMHHQDPSREPTALERGAREKLQGLKPVLGIVLKDGDEGLVVVDLARGGPCAKAGVAREDVILRVDGLAVETHGVFKQVMGHARPGDTVEIGLVREGNEMMVVAHVGGAGVKDNELARLRRLAGQAWVEQWEKEGHQEMAGLA